VPESAAPEALSAVLSTGIAAAGLFVGLFGALVIVWGVLLGVFGFARLEVARLRGAEVAPLREALRSELAYYLLVGLEFLVAADILETIAAPDLQHLAVLGGIVVIRTVISATLTWELRQSAAGEG
jgi:uncharacterized membrane protein